MTTTDMIRCEIDGALVHSIQHYINKNYPTEWTVEKYKEKWPDAPLYSEKAKDAIRQARQQRAVANANTGPRTGLATLFGFPIDKVRTKQGKEIECRIIDRGTLSEEDLTHVPDPDPNYIFNIELTKVVLMAMDLNKPLYLWGLHGTGKTSVIEQVCAKTGRPFMRVQHTGNTEEAHVLGQYVVRTEVHTAPDGTETKHAVTQFNLGPLPLAMLNGWTYCADEYDAALPSVSILYQPVLEGKPLVIKDAPPEYRMIRPHPNFRFVATGNTNGCGDETGLYQGTQIQNAANYSRFGITEEVKYMDPKIEAAIVASQAGIRMEQAHLIVNFATEVRKGFEGGLISSTISPRELINAGQLGVVTGNNWRQGLMFAFANRLSRTDKEVCDQYAQRVFG